MEYRLGLLDDEKVLSLSNGEVKNFGKYLDRFLVKKAEINGLFCQRIFGPIVDYTCECGITKKVSNGEICPVCQVPYISSYERNNRFGHIELNTVVLPPLAIDTVAKIWGLSKTKFKEFIIDNKGYIGFIENSEGRFYTDNSKRYKLEYSLDKGENFVDNLYELLLESEKLSINPYISMMENPNQSAQIYFNKGFDIFSMLLSKFPVSPAGMRDRKKVGEELVYHEDNLIYHRIIREALRINSFRNEIEDKKELRELIAQETKIIQKLINGFILTGYRSNTKKLIEPKIDLLNTKEGLLRSEALGKRIDFSGRSVITSGPFLPIDTVGVPMLMLIELFTPDLIRELTKKLIKENKIGKIKALRKAKSLIKEKTNPILYDLVEDISKDYMVMMNRAPSLHRFSVMSFKIKPTFDKVLYFPPMACKPFGADFDGDCLSYDTIIPTLDGKNRTIVELIEDVGVGGNVWVYSLDETTNKVVPGKATVLGCSGHKSKMYKITYDNGLSDTCSPEHKWLLRDNTWVKAKDLKVGDSLMPLYRSINKDGYEVVKHPLHNEISCNDFPNKKNMYFLALTVIHNLYNDDMAFNEENYNKYRFKYVSSNRRFKALPKWKWVVENIGKTEEEILTMLFKAKGCFEPTHIAVYSSLNPEYININKGKSLKDSYHIHHNAKTKDGNWDKLNNDPDNLKLLTFKDHLDIHQKDLDKRNKLKQNVGNLCAKSQEMHKIANKFKRMDCIKKLYAIGDIHYWISELKQYPIGEYWRKCLRDLVTSDIFKWFVLEELKLTRDNLRLLRRGKVSESDIISGDYKKSEYKEVDTCGFGRISAFTGTRNRNHKIVKIEIIEKNVPTYDLQVEKYHNFATGSGVFTHNTLSCYLIHSYNARKEQFGVMAFSNNLMSSAGIDKPNTMMSHEMIVGSYILTKAYENLDEWKNKKIIKYYDNSKDIEKEYSLGFIGREDKVILIDRNKNIRYTICVGSGVIHARTGILVDYVLGKSGISKFITKVCNKFENNTDLAIKILTNSQTLFFETATKYGISIAYQDCKKPVELSEILEKAKYEAEHTPLSELSDIEKQGEKIPLRAVIWDKAFNTCVERWFKETPQDNALQIMGKAGARVTDVQVKAMILGKGLQSTMDNKLDPNAIYKGLSEGLDPISYMKTCGPARRGFAANMAVVPSGGYGTRQFVTACRDLSITTDDCGNNKKGIILPKDKALYHYDLNNNLITEDNLHTYNDYIEVRSPLTCKHTDGLCKKCCGVNLKNGKDWDLHFGIGTVAAQTIMEVLQQTAMQGKHQSGSVSLKTFGARADNLLADFLKYLGARSTQLVPLSMSLIEDTILDLEGKSYEEKASNFVLRCSEILKSINYAVIWYEILGRGLSNIVFKGKRAVGYRHKGYPCDNPEFVTMFKANTSSPSWLKGASFGYTKDVIKQAVALNSGTCGLITEKIIEGKNIIDD